MRWLRLALTAALVGSGSFVLNVGAQDLPDLPPVGDDGGPIAPGEPLDLVSDPNFALGVVVGAAGLGLAAWLAFRGGAKFVTRENVLENETRYGMYDFIRAHPGMHLRAIAETLNLSTTNVLWHLRKLEEADLVRSQKLEGYKLFYPIDGGLEGKRRAMASAVLRNDNAQEILEYVVAHPGAHQREMARALGVNHGTVRWHLRKMLATDLLFQIKREHAVQYYLTDLGAAVLTPVEAERASQTPPPAAEGGPTEATA